MKKVLSTLILGITFPIKLLKRTKIDNFVGGLIFGALFSLFVNVVTVQIQETIQKQRILEAVENEILNNTLQANYVASQNQTTIDQKGKYNPFYGTQRYTRDIWTQSTEPLQYVAQLDQDTQTKVVSYYSATVNLTNRLLDNVDYRLDKELEGCFEIDSKIVLILQEKCNDVYHLILGMERDAAMEMAKNGIDVLTKFHPTQDRLNNWFLRLLMGNKSTRVLSGK